ncbi:MAG: Ig-like domain-containing protein [Bacteroidales bacterium]|nr:Ig-like domain-containing protein [Bacteroidales bacterium]
MIQLNNKYLYVKGTCNVTVTDPSNGHIDYQSNKVQTAQLTTSVSMNEVRAGLGNSIAIQLPTDSAVNLELTSADFSMSTRAMQIGSTVTYNAAAPTCEVITAAGDTLTLSKTAVAPQGFSGAIAYVNDGTSNAANAYEVNASNEVVGFTATNGVTYRVYYWVNNASAQQVKAYSVFAPAVKHVAIQMAVYSTENTSNAAQGSLTGWLYCIIPRMQFSAKADTDGSQSANATSVLSGTALAYDPESDEAVCTDCGLSELAYWVYVPAGDVTQDVDELVVVGGGLALVTGSNAQLPVRFLMKDGSLVVPDYSLMSYLSGASATATVSTTGVVTAAGVGNTTITATLTADNTKKAVVPVTVTAS